MAREAPLSGSRDSSMQPDQSNVEPVPISEAEIQAAIANSVDWPNGDPTRRWWRRLLRRFR